MARSINAALFGSLLLTLPLAVAGLPGTPNPYLVPHAAEPFRVAPSHVQAAVVSAHHTQRQAPLHHTPSHHAPSHVIIIACQNN